MGMNYSGIGGTSPSSQTTVFPLAEEVKGTSSLGNPNPKDIIGAKKVPLGLLPAAGKIQGALAMAFGAKKYEPYNWRKNKVQYTIYLDAIERHLLALRDGENFAEDSDVHHLGHIIAGASILADCIAGGFLIDDRPVSGPASSLLKEHDKSVVKL